MASLHFNNELFLALLINLVDGSICVGAMEPALEYMRKNLLPAVMVEFVSAKVGAEVPLYMRQVSSMHGWSPYNTTHMCPPTIADQCATPSVVELSW